MAERRLHVLNNSRAAAFRRCPRLHFFAYELGYVPLQKSEPLTTGTIYHKALEQWWLAHMEHDAEHAFERARSTIPPIDSYEFAKIEAILMGYDARWGSQELEVLGVEVPFAAPLIDPITSEVSREFVLGGTMDAVCRALGREFVVEHKTTSQDFSPGAYYWEKLALNSQVSHYLAAGPSLGFSFSGCLYDVIGKAPNIEPRLATPEAERKYTKDGRLYARQRDADEEPGAYSLRVSEAIAEAPERFFARGEVVRVGDELESSLLDVWQVGELISEARERSRWPRNPDACFLFGSACDYWGVCARGESLENKELFVCEREV